MVFLIYNSARKTENSWAKNLNSRQLTLHLSQKQNSKMDHNLKCKCKTIKILKDNIGKILSDLWFGYIFFFYKTQKAQYRKENN